MRPTAIVKRDGQLATFDVDRIADAIGKALASVGEQDQELTQELASVVARQLALYEESETPHIEAVQDAVILVLQESGHYDAAQSYIRYRDARERQRRQRAAGNSHDPDAPSQLNLQVIGRDSRKRSWSPQALKRFLRDELKLHEGLTLDVTRQVELMLAESELTEISSVLLLSLVDAALAISGAGTVAEQNAPLRIDREAVRTIIEANQTQDGLAVVQHCGFEALKTWSLSTHYGSKVRQLYACGRLWFDGLEDPLRASHYILTVDGKDDPWQLLTEAYSVAASKMRYWQDISLILPPMILGCLERGDPAMHEAVDRLGHLAAVYLYCDGRTPLLDQWPLTNKKVGIATYTDDFLLQARLQELGLKMMTGPHLMQSSYRRRVAVRLAINAQGLDEQHGQLDLLAMAVVSAAKVRLKQLQSNAETRDAEVRYAIFGLPPSSTSNEYLERQIVQEGLREGVALSRTARLSGRACTHLARLFE
jgi:hypothetical protein